MTTYVIDSTCVSDGRVKTDAVFPTVLAILFVLVYTQGYLGRVGIPSSVVKALIEAPVFLILLHLINRGVWQPAPGFFLVALYVVWAVVSTIFHGDGVNVAFLYCRYVVYAYVVFTAVWNTPLTKVAVTRINAIIASLLIFQIVASAHEVFIVGQRVEAHVGALSAESGGLATVFPLFAMGLTLSLYLHYRPSILLLILSWAYLLVGYASGKRAVYFLAPSLYIFTLALYLVRVRTPRAFKRFLEAVVLFVCLLPVLLLGVSRSHGISQTHSRNSLERIGYAFNAAVDYTTGETQVGRTTGRMATNRRVLSTLWSVRAQTVLFGWGPSAMRTGEEERYEKLMITYGICGWARDVICIGWPGMIICVLFQLRVFFCLWSHRPPRYSAFWMAMRFGAEIGFFVIMLSYISYSSSTVTVGHLSYVYFYLLALLMSPQHKNITMTAS